MNLSARVPHATRMRRFVARTIACGLLLLILPACGIPPLRKSDPPPGLPPDFNGRATAESSAQTGLEEFYNDPNLTDLIRAGLANNRELKIQNEEIQIASNEVLARSGQYLPFLSVGAGAGLNRVSRFTEEGAGIVDDPFLPGRFFTNPHGSYQAGLNLTWQLDIYRQLRNARDAAGQRYNSAAERRNFTVTRLVAEIAENYYRLMSLDKRIENLNQTIELQEQGLKIAQALLENARGTQLGVLRFQSEVRRNQSDKLVINQDIIETENRINFLINRYPEPVGRNSDGFYDLYINAVNVGVPSQLLQNRPDIRQAERDLAASGLDVKVARVNFYPQLVLNGGVGLESFNIRYLFEPQAVIGNLAAGLVGPLVNRRGIKAQYMTANARQLQSIYNYQRTLLEAFTQVVNRITMVENYTNSLRIKTEQVDTLASSVEVARQLFQNPRGEEVDYIDVLLANRDLRDARMILIDTKLTQLEAIVNAYQSLGGGDLLSVSNRVGLVGQAPYLHTVVEGDTFARIAEQYYHSSRFAKALWTVNKKVAAEPDRLTVGMRLLIPPINQLDPALIEGGLAPGTPDAAPAPATDPTLAPPATERDPGSVPTPDSQPQPPPPTQVSPFGQAGHDDPTVKPTSYQASPRGVAPGSPTRR